MPYSQYLTYIHSHCTHYSTHTSTPHLHIMISTQWYIITCGICYMACAITRSVAYMLLCHISVCTDIRIQPYVQTPPLHGMVCCIHTTPVCRYTHTHIHRYPDTYDMVYRSILWIHEYIDTEIHSSMLHTSNVWDSIISSEYVYRALYPIGHWKHALADRAVSVGVGTPQLPPSSAT